MYTHTHTRKQPDSNLKDSDLIDLNRGENKRVYIIPKIILHSQH